jgi:hypothetical protein
MPSLSEIGGKAKSFDFGISAGIVDGFDDRHISGRRTIPSIGTTAHIWPGTASLMPFPTVAAPLVLSSSSVNDTAAGTGAQSVLVVGIGSDWSTVVEVVAMDGTDSVQTSADLLRVNAVRVNASGTLNHNEGLISGTIGGAEVTAVLAARSRAESAAFTTSSDVNFYITNYFFDINSGTAGGFEPNAIFSLFKRENADMASSTWIAEQVFGSTLGGGPWLHPFRPVFKIGPKTDVAVQISNTNVTNIVASAGFDGILETI